ncbi:thioredoxin-like protein [Polychytrium aggregatum]|uniref:thioredoxin-like protein n=1 Tax=Polychytrium aggregatum TaxID=110093 RepID=UPI0022FE8BB7|nr:thioredoxin-like protein [Polychytrium aggregatum]KAI9204996.1 thioredoxin-like protein [Polychytrium aggregatum]
MSLSQQDQAIIRALQAISDPDAEPYRPGEDGDADSESENTGPSDESAASALSAALPPDMARIVQSNDRRQALGVGGSFTGPKGVVADHRFFQAQERSRRLEERQRLEQKIAGGSLSSGWLQRQIASESGVAAIGETQLDENDRREDDRELDELLEDFEDDPYVQQYRSKRLVEMKLLSTKTRYGSVREIQTDDEFVAQVEQSEPDTVVVIHLYQAANTACRLVNGLLDELAKKYPYAKFMRMVSTVAQTHFDEITLPILLGYRGGSLIKSLVRVTDEFPSWNRTNRLDPEEFEELMIQSFGVDQIYNMHE